MVQNHSHKNIYELIQLFYMLFCYAAKVYVELYGISEKYTDCPPSALEQETHTHGLY
uniref:Uncharacterized protein n=1 Tax=Arundo donax TaxID=35708 RepID=A0A0A9B0A1_ARUDO